MADVDRSAGQNRGGVQFARGVVATALPALLISAGAMGWCWWATGATLGLFIGAAMLMTIETPSLALAEKSNRSWLAAAMCVVGTAVVLWFAHRAADISFDQWLRCGCVLAAYGFALTALALLLAAARCPRPLAAAVAVLCGLLWLSWPVWLSPWLTQPLADWLVPVNPLFAINSAVPQLGAWDRAPLAYGVLSVLNQDIPYKLPPAIWRAVLLHLGAGAVLILPIIARSIVSWSRSPRPAAS